MARPIPEHLQRVLQGSIRRGEGQGIEQIEQSNPAVFKELHLEGACCELGKQNVKTEKVGKALQDIKCGEIRLRSSSSCTGAIEYRVPQSSLSAVSQADAGFESQEAFTLYLQILWQCSALWRLLPMVSPLPATRSQYYIVEYLRNRLRKAKDCSKFHT